MDARFTVLPFTWRLLDGLVLSVVILGFAGLLLRRNLFLKVLAMDVMGTGVTTAFVLIAARAGLRTPILLQPGEGAYADPMPQAVILTAIVIGLSIQALLLVVVMKLSRHHPALLVDEIESEGLEIEAP